MLTIRTAEEVIRPIKAMKIKLAILALSVASIFAQLPGPTMKAIVAHQWGGPEALKLEDVAIRTPKENEMLIKVFAAGVNSFDGTLLTGKYAKIFGTQLRFRGGVATASPT